MDSKTLLSKIAQLVGVKLQEEEAKPEEVILEAAHIEAEPVVLAEEEKPIEEEKKKEEEEVKEEKTEMAVEDMIAALEARIKMIEDYMKADEAESVAEEAIVESKKEEKMSAPKKFKGQPKEEAPVKNIVNSKNADSTINKVWEKMAQFK
jgi:hypothetical protein